MDTTAAIAELVNSASDAWQSKLELGWKSENCRAPTELPAVNADTMFNMGRVLTRRLNMVRRLSSIHDTDAAISSESQYFLDYIVFTLGT